MASDLALSPLQLLLCDNFIPVLQRLRAGVPYVEKNVLRLSCFRALGCQFPSNNPKWAFITCNLSYKYWKSCSTRFLLEFHFLIFQEFKWLTTQSTTCFWFSIATPQGNIRDAVFLNSIYLWVSVKTCNISGGISINCNLPGLDFSPSLLVHETLTTTNFLGKQMSKYTLFSGSPISISTTNSTQPL